ncbi:hypothetical protein X975_18604, partial [Stegodyphus mimosarum]
AVIKSSNFITKQRNLLKSNLKLSFVGTPNSWKILKTLVGKFLGLLKKNSHHLKCSSIEKYFFYLEVYLIMLNNLYIWHTFYIYLSIGGGSF